MSYSFIKQLVDNGYSEEELIASLSKSIPRLAKKAHKMFLGGWSPKEVLNIFAKDKEADKISRKSLKPVTPAEIADMRLRNSYLNIPKGTSEQSREDLQDFTKKAAPFALGAAAPLAAPMAEAALARALPKAPDLLKKIGASGLLPGGANTSPQPQPNSGSIQGQNLPTQQNAVPSQPPVNQVAPNVAQTTQPVQAKGITTNIIKNSVAYRNQIDALIKSGNGPEEIEGYLQKFNPSFIKTISKEAGAPFKDVVAQYIQEKTRDEALQPEGSQSGKILGKEDVNSAKPEMSINEPEKRVEKGSIVASPQGVGKLLESRNGKSLIEVDGKRHQVDEDELISSPLPEKDLADLFDDLVSGIEKTTGQQVSKNVEWAGYDPKVNELIYKPHGSDKVYVYDDIPPEDAQQLTSLLTQRKTTGENFVGPWTKGTTSPIGAAMHKLIQKIQGERGGKGNEYRNRFDTIYDAFEPAKLAKKKKHAERKKKA